MADHDEPDETEAEAETEADAPAAPSVRDRWWWSPTLNIVAGCGVVAYQWEPITQSKAIFLTWVIAAVGAAVAVVGLVRLVRAYPRSSSGTGAGPV